METYCTTNEAMRVADNIPHYANIKLCSLVVYVINTRTYSVTSRHHVIY